MGSIKAHLFHSDNDNEVDSIVQEDPEQLLAPPEPPDRSSDRNINVSCFLFFQLSVAATVTRRYGRLITLTRRSSASWFWRRGRKL